MRKTEVYDYDYSFEKENELNNYKKLILNNSFIAFEYLFKLFINNPIDDFLPSGDQRFPVQRVDLKDKKYIDFVDYISLNMEFEYIKNDIKYYKEKYHFNVEYFDKEDENTFYFIITWYK